MKRLPSIYKYKEWEDAMKHVAEEHGIAGHLIVRDPNQAPIMWHEFAHTSPEMGMGTWDHEHDDTTPESVRAKMEENLRRMPEIAQHLEDSASKDEAIDRTKKYYEGLE